MCRALSILTCLVLWAAIRSAANAQQPGADGEGPTDLPSAADPPASDGAADKPLVRTLPATPFMLPVLPAPITPASSEVERGVRWSELARASSRFLAIEHSFRLLTEPGTREGLKGSFIRNYGRSVANLHGWADGDEFYVNYVGHPMQGGVAGFLWVQNDLAYRHSVFGRDRQYWKSRLRAAAFIWCYSTQFEIGPLSEASIGGIQSLFPQQGFVDHVITPSMGMGWMIGEDVVDRYIIEPIEARIGNRWARIAARGVLNPSRSFSNVISGRAPWARTTRAGILSYTRPTDRRAGAALPSRTAADPQRNPDTALAPPFEFAMTFQPERFWGQGTSLSCLGGGGEAAFRLAPSWQLVTAVGGCKMIGLEKNLSGDSLAYTVGPRWLGRIRGPLSAHLQLLVGGNKITEERMFPELKKVLEAAALRDKKLPPAHEDYTEQTESNGFAVVTGAGLRYDLNRALTITVADLSYRRSWTSPLWGRDYSNSLKFSSGLVLRMGTW